MALRNTLTQIVEPPPIAPQISPANKQWHCPKCQSSDILIHSESYDFGMDPETGYIDAGESSSYQCLACGHTGNDVEGDL